MTRWGGITATLALLALAATALTSCRQTPPEPAPEVAALRIEAPREAPAGRPLPLSVVAAGPDGAPVQLLFLAGDGPRAYSAPLVAGRAAFTLDAASTLRAGQVGLLAFAGERRAAASLRLRPGPPAPPLVPLVGPRSIEVGGVETSMLVALPADAAGNPVADGTSLEARIQAPDGSLRQQRLSSRGGLAWLRLSSGQRAGRAHLALRSGAADGPEASLDEVAAAPESVRVAAEPASAPADGRQLLELRTDPLRDRFGNTLPDGVRVSFLVESGAAGPRELPAVTVGGQARAFLQAPEAPELLLLRARVAGVESPPLPIPFGPGPAVGAIPVRASARPAAGLVEIRCGPLYGPLGQWAPDGTRLTLRFDGPEGRSFSRTILAQDGQASLTLGLSELASGSWQVAARAGSGRGGTRFRLR